MLEVDSPRSSWGSTWMDMVVLIGDGGRRMVKRYFLVQFSILKFLGKLHSILCTYVKRNSDSFLMFRNYIL